MPSSWLELAELPRTPNGKLDRRELTRWAAEQGRRSRRLAETLPGRRSSELLAAIFADVLGIARVGRTDSFFHLGGHSLLATRVVSRVREALGAELPLRALFEAPTVEALARRIAGSGQSPRPAVEPVERTGELPLSFAQERLWFLDQLEPGSPAYNLPGAVRLEGRLEPGGAGRRAHRGRPPPRGPAHPFRDARQGSPRRSSTAPSDGAAARGRPRQRCPKRREAEAGRLRREEALRPFDLGRGPCCGRCCCGWEASDVALPADPAPHRLGRLVDRGADRRDVRPLRAPSWRASRRRWPISPCSMATSPLWQRRWLAGDALAGGGWPGGGSTWPARRRCWSCRPIIRGRRWPSGRGGRERLATRASCGRGCEGLAGARARRSS